MLKAHRSLSSSLPRDVTDRAQMNSEEGFNSLACARYPMLESQLTAVLSACASPFPARMSVDPPVRALQLQPPETENLLYPMEVRSPESEPQKLYLFSKLRQIREKDKKRMGREKNEKAAKLRQSGAINGQILKRNFFEPSSTLPDRKCSS